MKKQILLFTFLLSFLLLFTVSYISGTQIFVVTSNSMQPTFSYGDVLLAYSQEHYSLDDIISYKINTVVITHRVNAIYTTTSENSTWVEYQTQGDANTASDKVFISQEMILGKVFFIFPFVGYCILIIQSKYFAISLVVLAVTSFIHTTFQKVKTFKRSNES